MRIGHGYDVHRLIFGRKLMLGGVRVPYGKGLDGHSDADVIVHAIMDALLGAAALGDIGKLFPENDDAFLDISSLTLLATVKEKIAEKGYKVGNIDGTIVAQKPRLAPYIAAMVENIANVLEIDQDQVNIKATTEERLGFTGAGEGIGAHAVCLLERVK